MPYDFHFHIVKAMIFPGVMYRCEIGPYGRLGTKELMLSNCGLKKKNVVLKKTLESPLDSKEIKLANPKGNQSWILTGRTGTEANPPHFGHLMWWANSLEKTLILGKIEGRRRRGWQRMRWLDGITDTMDMNLSKFQEIVDRGAWHATVHGVAE